MMYEFAIAVGLPQPPSEIEIYVDHDPESLARAYISHVGDKENEPEWNLQRATDYWGILNAKAGTGYAIIKNVPPNTRLGDGYLRDRILVGGHEMFHIAYQYGLSGLSTNRSWFAEREPDRLPSWLEEGMAEWARHASLAHAGEQAYRLSRHEVIEEVRTMGTGLSDTEWIDDHSLNAEGRRCVFVCGEAAVELLASQVGIRGLTEFYTQLAPGVPWQSTFEQAYGISVDDFYEMFEDHRAAGYPELTIPVEIGGDIFFSPQVAFLPTPTPTPRYTLTTREDDPYYKQFIEVEGVTVKAAAHVDPAALQAAAHIMDVMLDGREDIAECMADAGAGMLIIPKDDPLTSLPEYSHWKGKADPKAGRSYDEIIRGSGGHPAPDHPNNAATDETHLLWTPPDPEVTAHEYAHTIQNTCFTQEDDTKWNSLYDTARQLSLFPDTFAGRYLMLDPEEFWAMLSNVYLGADRVLNPGNRAKVRSLLETNVPGVWDFLEEIYGVLTTPTPDEGSLYVHYGIEGGETFPWRTYVGGTYEDDEFGYSIDVPPGWVDYPNKRTRPDFAMYFRQGSAYLDISAVRLPNRDRLRSFAEGIRDRWLEGDSLMFEIDSFEGRREKGRESWLMIFRSQYSARNCPEDGMALIALSSSYDDKPYVFILRSGTCRDSQAQDRRRQDLLDMFASFR